MCPNDEKLHTKKINYHYSVTLFSLFFADIYHLITLISQRRTLPIVIKM
ncbi:hypothetical protein gpAD87_06960 [Paenibacillus sp. AD87]|nr:hypothetical protein gpAD87_06960 [Paenibacillus sp. AD87]